MSSGTWLSCLERVWSFWVLIISFIRQDKRSVQSRAKCPHHWDESFHGTLADAQSWTPYGLLASLAAPTVRRLPAIRETPVQLLGWEDPLEKEMAPHSSTLAWRIPWTEEPGRLWSMGSQRVKHNWATSLSFPFLMFWKQALSWALWSSRYCSLTLGGSLMALGSFLTLNTRGNCDCLSLWSSLLSNIFPCKF